MSVVRLSLLALLLLPACSKHAPLTAPDGARGQSSPTTGAAGPAGPRRDAPVDPAVTPQVYEVRPRTVPMDPNGTPPVAYDPPSVRIVSPAPSPFLVHTLPPDPLIVWEGLEPPGGDRIRLVEYLYRTFRDDDPEFSTYLANPDSIRRRYTPYFEGWERAGAEVTGTRLVGLVPGRTYLFVLTAADFAGDPDPVFSHSKNMVRIRVTPAAN